jgi:DNA sulfur modification protein DndD
LKIETIRLVNFRQFKDVTVDLTRDECSAVVFVGKTGAGKTNLLNALTWCLYGEEMFRSKQAQDGSMPLVNVGPLEGSLALGDTECSVELMLVFDDGRKAIVKRAQRFEVVSANDVQPLARSELRIQEMIDLRGYSPIPTVDQWMNIYMPHRLRPYYILNTERLEQFFYQDTESVRVKEAILQLAQIDLLGRMKQRFETVRSELLSASSDDLGVNPVEAQLQKNRQSLIKKVDGLRDDIGVKTSALEHLEEEAARLERRMGGVEKAARIVAEHAAKRERLDIVLEEFKSAEARKHQTLASEAPGVLALDAIRRLQSEISEAWKAGRIPAPISPDFLAELLKREVCICHRDLRAGSEGALAIEEFKNTQELTTAYGHFLHAQSTAVAVLYDRAVSFRSRMEPYQDEIDRLEREGSELRQRVEFLHKQMTDLGIDDKDFALLKEEWDRAQRARDKTRDELRNHALDLNDASNELARVEKLIGIEMRKNERKRATGERLRFAEKCLSTISSAYDQLLAEAREHVSSALNRTFLEMIWKRDTFTGALIRTDYSVEVMSALGFDAGADLSGGEDVCLALAFSQALGDVSGFELPLVLDSPLVKLDDEVKVRVARTMGENLEKRQLLLLMKPDEFGVDVRRALEERLSVRIVDLEFDEKSQQTKAIG